VPNVRPNVVAYATVKKKYFTGGCTERPGNVVSKHVSVHASSEIGNYIEELQQAYIIYVFFVLFLFFIILLFDLCDRLRAATHGLSLTADNNGSCHSCVALAALS